MSKIVIGRQFCGPPNSGNGGYVCGLLAKGLDGTVTSVLRAPIPLDQELGVEVGATANAMFNAEGTLIAEGRAAEAELPEAPPAPSLEEARAAGARYLGHEARFHPVCFTCGTERTDGDGLRVFPGQVEGAEAGVVACTWTPHESFADADGRLATENLWAALDCPGYFAWVVREGRHGALLGTMTGEVRQRPKAGEECIVAAWPIAREGRKELAGVALYSASGELLARAHQVWIVMPPRPQMSAAAAEAASA